MNSFRHIFLMQFVFFVSLSQPGIDSTSAQLERRPIAVLEGLKIPLDGYGNFSVAYHPNRDSGILGYRNYRTSLSIWVGGILAGGDTVVYCGDSDGKKRGPQWYPTKRLATKTSSDGAGNSVHHSVSEYANLEGIFNASLPKVIISQETYQVNKKPFLLVCLRIQSPLERGLKRVYVGLFGIFQPSDSTGRAPLGSQSLSALGQEGVPLLTTNIAGTNKPTIGLLSISSESQKPNFWENGRQYESDNKRYVRLASERKIESNLNGNTFALLTSVGPLDLSLNQVNEMTFVVFHSLTEDIHGLIDEAKKDYNKLITANLRNNALILRTREKEEAVSNGNYELFQNTPNPFNPTTRISFHLPKASMVSLTIYDLLGRGHPLVVDRQMNAGTQSIVFDAQSTSRNVFTSGIYFYRLEARAIDGSGGVSQIKKMLLLK